MKHIKLFEEFAAQNTVDEAYAGNISDFKYDLEMAIEELGFSSKAVKQVSKTGKRYEVRMSSYMSQRNAWEKIGEIIGATLVDFKADPKSINVGVYESYEENIEEGIDIKLAY
jgi:heterodisulfide reductase subunit B